MRVAWVVVGVAAVSIVLGAFRVTHLQRDARLDATARILETGVDQDGYWYARVEFTNAGTIPWYSVHPSRFSLLGDPGFQLEVGSTLPYGEVPTRLEVIVEAVNEGVVPARPEGVALHFSVLSADPWYLGQRRIGNWSYELPL